MVNARPHRCFDHGYFIVHFPLRWLDFNTARIETSSIDDRTSLSSGHIGLRLDPEGRGASWAVFDRTGLMRNLAL